MAPLCGTPTPKISSNRLKMSKIGQLDLYQSITMSKRAVQKLNEQSVKRSFEDAVDIDETTVKLKGYRADQQTKRKEGMIIGKEQTRAFLNQTPQYMIVKEFYARFHKARRDDATGQYAISLRRADIKSTHQGALSTG